MDILNQSLAGQFSSNLDAIQGSQTLRIKVWLITLSLIGDAPIFGHGLGRFAETFYETIISNAEFHSSPHFSASLSHPHNEILYLLAEHGVIGFLLIAVPLIYMATGMMTLRVTISLYSRFASPYRPTHHSRVSSLYIGVTLAVAWANNCLGSQF